MDCPYGDFSPDGREFHITTPRTPRHWRNMLWNEGFLASVSQVGQGWAFAQAADGHRTRLITGRMVYLLDAGTGRWWTANALPVDRDYSDYRCTHGLGYTRIAFAAEGIRSQLTILVPRGEPCEVWSLALRNVGDRPRQLKVVPSFRTAIEGWYPGATHAWYEPDLAAVLARNVVRTGSHYAHETTGRRDQGFLALSTGPSGYDARERAFVGAYGGPLAPEALASGGCTNSACEFEKVIFALEATIDVAPGEERTVAALAGVWDERGDVATLRERFFRPGAIEAELDAVRGHHLARIAGLEIETPDADLDRLFNTWLKHQLRFNVTWARVYFDGYRDLCQDAANLAAVNTGEAWPVFERVLAHQHGSGYAPRAWVGQELVEQDYSDSPVWIAPAVHRFVAESGDAALLDREAPFRASETATVYEHVRRSLEYLWNDRGERRLSKIHRGDWNDIMNAVGAEGRGESVWLSMALAAALRQFAEVARFAGQDDDARLATERAGQLAAAINAAAWDGRFYLRAFTDDGLAVGSDASPEGMFLNPQCWAVLSGVAPPVRAAAVMAEVDERLETDVGISTLERTFHTGFRPEIGFISVVRPGANVNGGIYLHANAFKLIADCLLGRAEAAGRTLLKMLPFGPHRAAITGEPFVVPNAYFGPQAGYRHGEAGDSWVTGTAGWLVTAITGYVFGLRPTLEGLRVEPCLPPSWPTCRIRRTFRSAVYDVTFRRAAGAAGNRVERIAVDGETLDGTLLPHAPGGTFGVDVLLGPAEAKEPR